MTIKGGYRKYDEVSFLRGFAITSVVLMHLIQVYWNDGNIAPWLRFASALGGTGGHVFVFCSGFGLYLSYLHHPVTFGEFMKRRFLKIYVPYLIFLLIHSFLPHWGTDTETQIRYLLSHVFLYKMFYEKYICSFGLQFWFISTIIQLYFLFIPLCRLREKTSLKTMVLTSLAVSLFWWTVMYLTGREALRIWGSFCLEYIWEFALGMAAAEYMMNREEAQIPAWGLPVAAVCGLGLQVLMQIQGGILRAWNDIPALIGYASMVLLLFRYGKHILRPIFLRLDKISYEIYLVHDDGIKFGFYYSWLWIRDTTMIGAMFGTLLTLVSACILKLISDLVLRRLRGGRNTTGA